jgi:aryl-alcohol dehydrogenase-like predicted oxidoreductase
MVHSVYKNPQAACACALHRVGMRSFVPSHIHLLAMKYTTLGTSGLRVSELCLGTMTFGTEWGWGADAEECARIFEAYVAAGGNFIDTANYYTAGSSERILAPLIKARREELVVATKFSLNMDRRGLNTGGNHRKNIRQAAEASLKRLDTDYIDLYWLHAWDFTTGLEEVLRTLDDLVSSGKVLYVGFSDTPAWIVARAQLLAQLRGWEPLCAIQAEYSLIQRSTERELLPMAQALGLAVLAWSPLGSGLLTGKYADPQAFSGTNRLKEDSKRVSARNLAIAETLGRLARELGFTSAQLALAWVNSRGRQVFPIIGARTSAQLLANLHCLSVQLPEAALNELDACSAIELGFPHDFIHSDNVRTILLGDQKEAFFPGQAKPGPGGA